MKLPNMALVFAIILIPIVIVFSMYLSYQIKTVTNETSYDTKLMNSTRDAIEALELNTFGDSTKDLAESTRRNIQASVNTFVNSLAANFGVIGYDNTDILSYVPALLFTMYDGYYIYAPSADGINEYVLKPYIYYSARYKNGDPSKSGGYDVVVNYSLDNYISIVGTVNGEYVAKSGYLEDIRDNRITIEEDNENNTVKVDGIEIQSEQLYETMSFYLEDYNMDGEINNYDVRYGEVPLDVIEGRKEPTKVTLQCQYCYKNNQKYYYCVGIENTVINGEEKTTYEPDSTNYRILVDNLYNKWFTYNATGRAIRVNEESLGLNTDMLNDESANNYYIKAFEFSSWVKETFPNGIKANTMVKPDGTFVSDIDNVKDLYYIFKDDDTNILNAIGDEESAFNQHKLNVMQASITYNLNVAISSYMNNKGEFKMPELSESEWDKILTNITMVSFVQGMPMGLKTYNNYAVVTSTNNQMYVAENSIYYVKDNGDTTGDKHHKANCKTIQEIDEGSKLTGYASTEYDMYTVNYETEGQIQDSAQTNAYDHYLSFYRHKSIDCYDCIISATTNKTTGYEIKRAKLHAKARIRYNQYKVTQYINEHSSEEVN